MKTLRKWNGRGNSKYIKHHVYVAAYSIAHAVRIMQTSGLIHASTAEIKNYYSECWGNNIDGIRDEEPCVYVIENSSLENKPIKIY